MEHITMTRKNQWLVFAWMMIIGFVGGILMHSQPIFHSRVLTSDEAREKTAYYRSLGFFEYSPQREGWIVSPDREQEQPRIDALADYIDQLGEMLQLMDSSRAMVDWNHYFRKITLIIEEANRLGLDTEHIQQVLNRLRAVAEKITYQFSVQPLVAIIVSSYSLEIPDEIGEHEASVTHHCLEVFPEISHIPIIRLVSSTTMELSMCVN